MKSSQLLCFLLALAISSAFAAPEKPNIILIMADDIGAEGLACYNSAIYTTPNLDRMAENGAIFDNAYSTPLCTPTRVMIMSGQYPNRTGYLALISKEEDVRLDEDLKTFGDYLQEHGYRTALAGKWQLGQFDVYPNQPLDHGFQNYCLWKWFFEGQKTSRYYEPGIWQDGESKDGGKDTFGPNVYSDYVLDFIEANKDEPYFIYFPMALVHSPFVVPPALEELAHSKYYEGMDKGTRNFGHMITYMDMLIGKIVEKVKETGQEENTLIVFTGDNGCHKSILSRLGSMDLKGGKGDMTEAGTRVPFICYWPGTVPPGRRDAFFCLVDVLPTLASLSGIEVDGVDGMDLSHNLLNQEGTDREHVFMAYKKEVFIRDKRFRLTGDGKLYDIPVSSDLTRYSEKVSKNPEHEPHRERLQKLLDEFVAIGE